MKVLIVANPTSAATDYYRTTGPFTRLSQRNPNISLIIEYPQNVKWHHMFAADVLLFQRPNGDDILTLIAEAKRMGKKIVLDIDDLLHGLTDANPASRHFNALNILTATPMDDTAMVVHQNHDDPNQNVVTPRDMDAVFANMPKRPMDEYRAFLDPKRWTK